MVCRGDLLPETIRAQIKDRADYLREELGVDIKAGNSAEIITDETVSHGTGYHGILQGIPQGKSIDELLSDSVKIEYPSGVVRRRSGRPKKDLRRILKAETSKLQKAFWYLFGLADGEYLNSEALIQTTNLLAPYRPFYQTGGYRPCAVKVDISQVPRPFYSDVPKLVDKLFDEVEGSDLCPIEKAALLHTGIAFIHPFTDGNGRDARLYEGRLLHEHNLPMARHLPADRGTYMSAVELAVSGYSKKRMGDMRFYTWLLATLVNRELERMINKYSDIRPKKLFGQLKLSGK